MELKVEELTAITQELLEADQNGDQKLNREARLETSAPNPNPKLTFGGVGGQVR